MTEYTLSFYEYITKTRGKNVDDFLEMFYDKLDLIPVNVVSSKYLMNVLCLTNRKRFIVFRNVYSDYFRYNILKEQMTIR